MSESNKTKPAPSAAELEQARREALRLKITRRKLGISGKIARAFLESKLTPLIIVASLLLGAFAIMVTPSEEEPQIKVPMIDVMVGYPGATAEEIETRVVTPLEKLLYEIENVEYIYSTSQPVRRTHHRALPGRNRPRPGGRQGSYEDPVGHGS